MNKLVQYLIKNLDAILVFLFSVIIFSLIIKYIGTDIPVHINRAIEINQQHTSYPANFLFYFLINLFSLFSNNISIVTSVTTLILSLSVAFKYTISKQMIYDLTPNHNSQKYANKTITFFALALLSFFAIPDFYAVFILEKMYLGRLTPIVWHNSTVILLFPFAILLFGQQVKILKKDTLPTIKSLIVITFLILINIIIKPSFIFVFLPVFFIIILSQFNRENLKEIIFKMTPLILGGLLIIIQYLLIYYFQFGSFAKDDIHIAIGAPFQVIGSWIPYWYIPIAFILSLALPIYSIIFYREILKFKPFLYSIYLSVFGILISAFIIETGSSLSAGNFTWQNVICTYILFLTTLIYLIPELLSPNKKGNKKLFGLKLIFTLHVFSGVLYLLKMLVTLSYY